LLVLFWHRFAIARRYCTAIDRFIDLLLPCHLRRLLFLRRLLGRGRSRRRGDGCRRRGGGCRRCGCWCWRSSRIRFSTRCGLGHRDARRHTHEHRRRHNTRKFLHLKLQLVLPRDRNRPRNPTTLPMQLSVPALKTDMEEGPGWVIRVDSAMHPRSPVRPR
jgi:hypothetical protein